MLLPACLFLGDSRQGPARKIIKVSTALMLCQGGEVCLFFQISKTLGSSLVLVPLLQRVDTAPPPPPREHAGPGWWSKGPDLVAVGRALGIPGGFLSGYLFFVSALQPGS